MGGGLQYGTSAVLLGPAGSGKSTLAIQYARAAAARGERAAIFAFDERLETILERTEGLGMDIAKDVEAGRIRIQPIDTAELSPGEFAHRVRAAVDEGRRRPGAKVVVIDSLNGYLNAMPEERFLIAQLHELLTYLGHKGVVTFLIVAQHGLVGHMESPIDTTYLADTVMLFRYFEAMGEVRQAISVVKKRSGKHERTIRELRLDSGGINVGPPLRDFQGVLTGTPTYRGPSGPPGSRAMADESAAELEERVLLLAPTRRDAAAAVAVFAAVGIALTLCEDIVEVCSEIERGAAVAIVPDEAILERHGGLPRPAPEGAAAVVRLPAHRPDAAAADHDGGPGTGGGRRT